MSIHDKRQQITILTKFPPIFSKYINKMTEAHIYCGSKESGAVLDFCNVRTKAAQLIIFSPGKSGKATFIKIIGLF